MKLKTDKNRTELDKQLRSEAEAQVPQSLDFDGVSNADKKLLHELRVHQVELQMQNEQLWQAQTIIEESRDLYVNLYEFAPVGYLTISTQGQIVEANLKAAAILDVTRQHLLQQFFSKFLVDADKDQWYRAFNRIKSLNAFETFVLDLRLKEEGEVEFYVRLTCLRMPENASEHIFRMTIMDVTQEKEEVKKRLEHEINLRNTLVREVHHRIKNSLQGLTGLLDQHANNHPELSAILSGIMTQVESIAVTDGLKGAHNATELLLEDTVREVAKNNQQVMQTPLSINVEMNFRAWKIKEEESVPIALVVNELLLNAMKHGVKNTMITISLEEQTQNNAVLLTITNFGALSNDDHAAHALNKGVGLKLVDSLLAKVGAHLSWQQVGGMIITQLTLTSPVITL